MHIIITNDVRGTIAIFKYLICHEIHYVPHCSSLLGEEMVSGCGWGGFLWECSIKLDDIRSHDLDYLYIMLISQVMDHTIIINYIDFIFS